MPQLQSVKIHTCRYSLSVFRGERFRKFGTTVRSIRHVEPLHRAWSRNAKIRHTLSSAPASKDFVMDAYQDPQPLYRRKINAKLTICPGLRVDKYHNF